MRVRSSLGLAVAVTVTALAFAPRAAAQNEDDEDWGDEEIAAPSRPSPRASTGRRPSAADLDEDDLDEDDLEVDGRTGRSPATSARDDETPPAATDEDGDDALRPGTPEAREAAANAAFLSAIRTGSTWLGPSGGLHVHGAAILPAHSFRLTVATEFFSGSDFLYSGDEATRVGGSLSLAVPLSTHLEVFGAITTAGSTSSRGTANPLFALADTSLGARYVARVSPLLGLGISGTLLVPTASGTGIDTAALGLDFRATAEADLRTLREPLPLILRANLGYTLDNSAQLVRDDEAARYRALEDPAPMSDEFRHLATREERFALGLWRHDHVRIALGLEAPLELAPKVYLHPIAEWSWDVPVDRQGYVCFFQPAAPGLTRPAPGQDSCLDRVGVAAHPMWLTLGARFFPPVRGLSLLAAMDIGLSGTGGSDSVRALPAIAPWTLRLALSFTFDLRPPPLPRTVTREVERRVQIREPAPVRGHVLGEVVERETNVPIPNAIVRYTEPTHPAQLTDELGHFVSDGLPATHVSVTVTAPGRTDVTCEATIPEPPSDVPMRCEMAAPVVVVEEEQVVVLEQIQFAFNSDVILSESFPLMQSITNALASNAWIHKLEIQGHTDDIGRDAHNDQLSQRRADSVKRWLVEHGIAEERLVARGFGERQPLHPNDSDEHRRLNRRVQFLITERGD